MVLFRQIFSLPGRIAGPTIFWASRTIKLSGIVKLKNLLFVISAEHFISNLLRLQLNTNFSELLPTLTNFYFIIDSLGFKTKA